MGYDEGGEEDEEEDDEDDEEEDEDEDEEVKSLLELEEVELEEVAFAEDMDVAMMEDGSQEQLRMAAGTSFRSARDGMEEEEEEEEEGRGCSTHRGGIVYNSNDPLVSPSRHEETHAYTSDTVSLGWKFPWRTTRSGNLTFKGGTVRGTVSGWEGRGHRG